MTTDVILEWRNLNLIIEKREFNYWKCRSNIEEKRILDNGKAILDLKKKFPLNFFFFKLK